MLSTLELRHLIESAFLPLSCQCQIDPGGSLRAQIFEPVTGQVELLVTGIPASSLSGNLAITKLIGEIRHNLKATHERQGLHRIK